MEVNQKSKSYQARSHLGPETQPNLSETASY